jgi:hypothetical protein
MILGKSRHQRAHAGTALVESVIIVPVLGLILAGVLAVHGLYAAKIEAKARARRLAWLQADSGDCPASSCSTSDCESTVREIRDRGIDALQTPSRGRLRLGSFLGELGGFFLGRSTSGVGSAAARLPRLLGRTETTLHGRMTLICNTTARRDESGVSVLEHACNTDLRTTEYAREICP